MSSPLKDHQSVEVFPLENNGIAAFLDIPEECSADRGLEAVRKILKEGSSSRPKVGKSSHLGDLRGAKAIPNSSCMRALDEEVQMRLILSLDYKLHRPARAQCSCWWRNIGNLIHDLV